ncbi:MAG TPA: Hsp33 family molecular chaperone HslO, partial [Lysobacter sp.]|nr:Hsp33 family molecular chaperone HslO [Lysobacter sp.]
AGALFDTLTPRELLEWPGETLLTRLFHEDGVQLLGAKPLEFACSCSRERVEAMLVSLGAEEARAALADDEAVVRCEFCGQSYRFNPGQIEQLFAPSGVEVQSAPERMQ